MDKSAEAPAASPDLGGHREGHPERLNRREHGGTLVEAEHLARYCWAARLADGKRVLDAGCGTAYGTRLLAEAGALEVVGVDRAAEVLDSVREGMPGRVRLQRAELDALPFEDGVFDLVVCFEVLEHLDDPEAGLDELARVLAEDGVLAVSSPNRSVYPPGNPHHVREYLPEELRESLENRFPHVRLLRQHAWVSSAVLDEETLAAGESESTEAELRQAEAIAPGDEIFTIGLASRAELPEAGQLVLLGPGLDQRRMEEARRAEIERHRLLVAQGARLAELEDVAHQLSDAEQRLADLPELYGARAELAAVRSSLSWRLTAPLRRALAALSRLAPPARMALRKRFVRFIERARGGS